MGFTALLGHANVIWNIYALVHVHLCFIQGHYIWKQVAFQIVDKVHLIGPEASNIDMNYIEGIHYDLLVLAFE